MNTPKVSNQDQIDRMRSLINSSGNTALNLLFELGYIKKQQNDLINTVISQYHEELLDSILETLVTKVESCELRKLFSVPIYQKDKSEKIQPLLHYLIGSTLKVSVDSKGSAYILIGSSIAVVHRKDMISFRSRFEDVKNVCKTINELWKGLAEIECFVDASNDNFINFGFDASPFIYEKKDEKVKVG